MSDFQSGKKEGYIYGYIFLSGNKGLVLDEGQNEYPIKSAELLINDEFILMENLTLDLLKLKGLYGSKARIKEVKMEKETELISYMDYQVLNNGMMGWLSNHCYREVFDYLEILNKRNSELDQKVASIFKRATVSLLEYHQYKSSTLIPECKEICDDAEKVIDECGKQYQEVAKEFMNSYGLEDYLTKFEKNF